MKHRHKADISVVGSLDASLSSIKNLIFALAHTGLRAFRIGYPLIP